VRYLILSDVHANWEALQAVVHDASGSYDEALCCGDLVGYGADPNAAVEWVREHCAVTVRGNHDKACTGLENLEWFNPVARYAALWTMKTLTPANAEWTRNLPRGPAVHRQVEVLHGAPDDEDEYVLAPEEAERAFEHLQGRVAFFGHTHIQGGFFRKGTQVQTILRPLIRGDRRVMEIDPECAYLINPGSVGQPRDGDPRAAYALFDSDAQIVTYRRVPYDIPAAQRKILDSNLPPVLADRLSMGR
jgi:diadenosine tetraphosphatase ApaH/serine/threonine PP2A family protein phosphatase